MTHEEIKKLLNDYFDEKLSVEVNTEIQLHISECDDCGQYLFSLQDLSKKAEHLPTSIKPSSDFWADIFASISDIKTETMKQKEELDSEEAARLSEQLAEEQHKRNQRLKAEKLLDWERKKATLLGIVSKPWFKYAAVGLIALIVLFLAYTIFLHKGANWEVRKVQFEKTNSELYAKLGKGDFLETNSFTRLEISIPEIGTVLIDPDTKIERSESKKISLLQGSILIKGNNNAAEFLSVNVPGAEISDYFLGNEYRISMKNQSETLLHVLNGWLSVKQNNLETLVLSNHLCKILSETVGLPYKNGSTADFVSAIEDFSFRTPGNEEALISILTKADVTNCVTLWNIMKGVSLKQRDMVIYTMFGLLGDQPAGVDKEGLKVLDKNMMQKLIEEIELKIQ
jgi:hypothetical protein